MIKKPDTTPYAVGLAVAFALLSPGVKGQSSQDPLLLGAADCSAGMADSCKPWTGWVCIHGNYVDENYCDPLECKDW